MSPWGADPCLPGSSGEGGAMTSGSGTTSGGGGGGAGGALTGVVDSGVSKASSESELLTERGGDPGQAGPGGSGPPGEPGSRPAPRSDVREEGRCPGASRHAPPSPPSEDPAALTLPGPQHEEQKHQSRCGWDPKSRSLPTTGSPESSPRSPTPTAPGASHRWTRPGGGGGAVNPLRQHRARRPRARRPIPGMTHGGSQG